MSVCSPSSPLSSSRPDAKFARCGTKLPRFCSALTETENGTPLCILRAPDSCQSPRMVDSTLVSDNQRFPVPHGRS